MVIMMIVMIMMVSIIAVSVEGESADERLAIPGDLRLSSESSGPQDTLTSDHENKKQLSIHIGAV